MLQLSYLQILNFLEKIIETELYILEGTGFGSLTLYSSVDSMNSPTKDALALHG